MMEIIQPGSRTTVQDSGRPGLRHLGLPQSGAADRLSYALVNWMVGNRWDVPALEATLGGLHVRFSEDTFAGIAGAEMWAQVNGQNVENYTAFPVSAGDILTFSFARKGCRAYLAVAGGIEADDFMGSRSTYLPAQIGGIEGRELKARDQLSKLDAPRSAAPQKLQKEYVPQFSNHIVLRAMPGPEFELLSLDSRRNLFVNPFQATTDVSRMGARLRGNLVEPETPIRRMNSAPILPGTLQIPSDGFPILPGVDGHTIGGYPRALQVIRADQWLIGQIKPGTKVSFQRCFGESSVTILKRRNAFYGQLMDGFTF